MKCFLMVLLFSNLCFAKEVTVVVLDSGYSAQPTIKKYVKKSFDFTKTSIKDTDGHASNVMSIISDSGNIDSKKLEMVPIKIFNGLDQDLVSYLNSLSKAIELDPDIINISYTHSQENFLEKFFLDKAHEKGIKVVVSAGNGNQDLDKIPAYPCSYELDNIYCVGNKKEKVIQSNSNYGSRVKNWEDGDNQIGLGTGEDSELSIMSGSSQSAAIFTQKMIKKLIINNSK